MSATLTGTRIMTNDLDELEGTKTHVQPPASAQHAFHSPRYFPEGPYVYTVISPRSRGLTIGVNLNPDRFCNFDCVYCEVAGEKAACPAPCEVEATSRALESVLAQAQRGDLSRLPCYQSVPAELMKLREVTLSGDGEPTLCPNFGDVAAAIIRIRAIGRFPFFKIVLVTNTSGLRRPEVQEGLRLFTLHDDLWLKLDAGTEAWFQHINRTKLTLSEVMTNIAAVGQTRPVVIQSLFPLYNEIPPPEEEVSAYLDRLSELKAQGTQIKLVQIYSAHRPTAHPECSHLPLRILSRIARDVREKVGLHAEVY